MDQNHIANLNILRLTQDYSSFPDELDRFPVGAHIRLITLVILKALSKHRHSQDENKGQNCRDGVHGRDCWNGVQDSLQEEVDISLTSELVHEREGQEGPHGVLGGADVVRFMLLTQLVSHRVVNIENAFLLDRSFRPIAVLTLKATTNASSP